MADAWTDLSWTAKYDRHHCAEEEECDSLEDAVRFLLGQSEFGELALGEVVGPEGNVVMTREQLMRINWGWDSPPGVLAEQIQLVLEASP